MLKINDTNVFTNYIKQILSSFPLPTCEVITENSKYPINGKLYLKDDSIVQYSEDEDEFKTIIDTYIEGKKYLNYTKTFFNTSIIYDTETHEYLGEYLRFLRDYKHLNLMSMYNCYSKHFMKNVKESYSETIEGNEKVIFEINTYDNQYKYIIVPIKLNKKYTIALDSNYLEMVCGFYNKSYYSLSGNKLIKETYIKRNYSNFNQPFIYDKMILNENNSLFDDKEFLYKHEKDLKLILKLPKDNSSSIVILEGNYLGTNDAYYLNEDINKLKRNNSKTNFDNKLLNTYNDIEFKSQLQLLEYNTKEDNVLSDRLMEYLTNLPITNIENISQNIVALQNKLIELYRQSTKITEINISEGDEVKKKIIEQHPYGIKYATKEGIWDDSYKAILYSMACNYGLIDSKKDIIGYVDKDLETKIGGIKN